ncbi:MAG: hypothetical protein NTZ60_08905 [Campylobacterales bacterium]|nr:hypothetical protein [Campylobacterales bacterium]
MKFTKMSLVAALLIGSSAFAIENIKVAGDAKLFYTTQDDKYATTDASLFDKKSSTGQAALGLGATADLTTGVSAGAHLTGLSTLGLQEQLVNNVWEGTNGTKDYYLFDEAWLAGTVANTTAKVGRMTLDTPLVFTEKWSIAKNTFEAGVLLNTDIPDTTVVGAYVGGTNSNNIVNPVTGSSRENGSQFTGFGNAVGTMQKVDSKGQTNFSQFYNGAYAIGAINNSFKPLTAQAWYYNATQYLNAYWVQADLSINNILAGLQYTSVNYTKSTELPIAKNASNNAVAAMLGYELKDTFTAKASYSQTGKEEDSGLPHGLGSGGNLAGSQSKLYTEAWWNYGKVTKADTKAFNITLTAPVADLFTTGLYYTQGINGKNGVSNPTEIDFKEATLEATKAFGPLAVGIYYIYTQDDGVNIKAGDTKGSAYNTVQTYLTYSF